MKYIFSLLGVFIFLSNSVSQNCTSVANSLTGGTKGWLKTSNWSCSGGASNPPNGAWSGGSTITIDQDFTIPNNATIDLTSSGITSITITSGGNLIFDSNAKILLPSGAQIIIESGGQVTADNNSGGTLIEIGGNEVWGRGCEGSGCNNNDLTGPGVIDENSTPGDPLPITLETFSASVLDESVMISWKTSAEINNDYFTIEKSSDGLNYAKLITVEGAGNSSERLEYSYRDRNPIFGRSYYRLKQTDYDGTSETFSPASVEFTSLSNGRLYFNNPVSNGEEVTLFTEADSDEELEIVVFNMIGEYILRDSFTGGSYSFVLDADVKQGIYFVRVNSINTQKTGRLVVQ